MGKTIFLIIIFILIITPFFVSAEETISINKFELIWSSDTYTPFDYQGRNLPIIGSKITVNAALNVSGGDIRNLKYSWFLEDIFQQNKSGYGKNEFYFYAQKRPGDYHTIRLQIFNEDRTVFEEKTIQIPVTKPELLIYSSNGNSHFLNQASKISAVLAGKTFSFIAKPYFFSINKLTDLIFEWTVNQQQPIISSDYNASILHLDVPAEAKSTENEILVNVKNSTAEEQKAYQTIKINIY